jgi:hypothetical protein
MNGSAELGRAVLELSTDSKQFFADLDKGQAAAKALGAKFTATGKDLDQFGSSLGKVGQSLAGVFRDPLGTAQALATELSGSLTGAIGVSTVALGAMAAGATVAAAGIGELLLAAKETGAIGGQLHDLSLI